jgi:hypothetical protein
LKPVVVETRAKEELRTARRWYEKRLAGLGDELLQEVLEALAPIERDNLIGVQYGATRYRFYRVRRLHHLLRVPATQSAHRRHRPQPPTPQLLDAT